MKRILTIFIALFFNFSIAIGFAQSITTSKASNRLTTNHTELNQLLFLLVKDNISNVKSIDKMFAFSQKLGKKRRIQKGGFKAIRSVYRSASQKFLKSYQQKANFTDLLTKGEYNCVSAALLYTYLFERLNFDYSIYVTNTHTYLKLHLPEGDVLLETTDPWYGIVRDEKRIESYLNAYIAESTANALNLKETCHYPKKISVHELVGVAFYNMFLQAYENKNYEAAAKAYQKAFYFYQSSPQVNYFYQLFANNQ